MKAVKSEINAAQRIILDKVMEAKCARHFLKATNTSIVSQSPAKPRPSSSSKSSPMSALKLSPPSDVEENGEVKDVETVKKALDFGASTGEAKREELDGQKCTVEGKEDDSDITAEVEKMIEKKDDKIQEVQIDLVEDIINEVVGSESVEDILSTPEKLFDVNAAELCDDNGEKLSVELRDDQEEKLKAEHGIKECFVRVASIDSIVPKEVQLKNISPDKLATAESESPKSQPSNASGEAFSELDDQDFSLLFPELKAC